MLFIVILACHRQLYLLEGIRHHGLIVVKLDHFLTTNQT